MNALESPAVVAVRRHFGGRLSPENEPPKLAYLAKTMPPAVFAATAFFDLADWLSWKCVGGPAASSPRSSCTVACKWGWGPLGVDGWSCDFWREVGLASLVDGDVVSTRIGREVVTPGACVGVLCAAAAADLGLGGGGAVRVGAGMIDAHAGALAMLNPRGGVLLEKAAPAVGNRLAMICGTSTCHLALTREPCFVGGVWGPFRDAVLPGFWCAEGGQSATGAYIDNLLARSAAAASLAKRATAEGRTLYEVLEALAVDLDTSDTHILPYVHGNVRRARDDFVARRSATCHRVLTRLIVVHIPALTPGRPVTQRSCYRLYASLIRSASGDRAGAAFQSRDASVGARCSTHRRGNEQAGPQPHRDFCVRRGRKERPLSSVPGGCLQHACARNCRGGLGSKRIFHSRRRRRIRSPSFYVACRANDCFERGGRCLAARRAGRIHGSKVCCIS
jgi:hypothetical protein